MTTLAGGSLSGAAVASGTMSHAMVNVTPGSVSSTMARYPFTVDADVTTGSFLTSTTTFTLQASDTDTTTATTIDRGAYCGILP